MLSFRLFFCTGLVCQVLLFSPVFAGTDTDLKAKANVFWQAQVQEDWETVYRMLPPEEKKGISKERYIAFKKSKGPLAYLTARVVSVTVLDDTGWVEVRYKARPYEYPQIPPRDVHTWQIWEQRDGQWIPVARSRLKDYPSLPPHMRSKEEEEKLTQRAEAYWQAIQEQDWERLYQFLPPAYRARVPKEKFLKRKSMFLYLDHHIEWAEAKGNRGRVKVNDSHKLNDPWLPKLQPKNDTHVEPWVKVEGEWYREIKDPAMGGNR